MSMEINPTIEEINKFKVPLMQGEQYLLQQLISLFDSTEYNNRIMEIFVQPNLFLGKPDFVIVEKNSGIWIIEVKDYQSHAYTITSEERKDTWRLSNDSTIEIGSPFEQVSKYKENLMKYANSSLEQLADSFRESKFKKCQYNKLFRTAVYFSNYTNEDISNLKRDLGISEENTQFNFSDFFNTGKIEVIRSSDLLDNFFEKMNSKSYQLTDEQYYDIRAILDPGDAGKNDPLPDFTESSYIEATKSIPARRKIRGEAGSGKTSVLAKRVTNCAKRLPLGGKILVVTYNITICNYIRDKIVSESGKTLNELGVTITHYHQLFKWKKTEVGLTIEAGKAWDEQFDAIFIDEGQDFKEEWFRLLIENYLINPKESTNEYVIFADEVQNIYSRNQVETIVDGRKTSLPITPVVGDWRTLKGNFRMTNGHILTIANEFKRTILNQHPGVGETILGAQQLNSESEISENLIIYKKAEGIQEIIDNIRSHVKYLTRELDAKINDIVVLSGSKELMRKIENELRNHTIENNIFLKTATTFMPKDKIDQGGNKAIDKSYKIKFFRNLGPMKFSTIHSFKGWEAKYVILLVHNPNRNSRKNESFDDSYYVGLTRAKDELLVIDTCGKYEKFFERMNKDVVIPTHV